MSLSSDRLSSVVMISENSKECKESAWLAKTGIPYVCNKVKEETDRERSRIYQQRRINKLLNQTFEMYLI